MKRATHPTVFLAWTLALLAACSSAPPPKPAPVVEDYFRLRKDEPPAAWFRIYVDGELSGYLKDQRRPRSPLEYSTTFWVYDSGFRELGFFTDFGTTVRNEGPRGSETLGVYSQSESILSVLGIPSFRMEGADERTKPVARIVKLEPMPRVWELESEEP